MGESIEEIARDYNLSPASVHAAMTYYIDVTTTIEAGLLGQSDELQLAFICEEKRVIMTHDEDFLTIASLSSDHQINS
ncbi:hypothetical protein BCD67_15155 [Oscillatoriales cyanobacterium USR001]|nr:hypothetical protein BCD67_15155 [Oscillatoriales cyanobacterium USR001]